MRKKIFDSFCVFFSLISRFFCLSRVPESYFIQHWQKKTQQQKNLLIHSKQGLAQVISR